MSVNSLVFDLKLFSADSKLRQNLLSVRAGVTQDPGYLKSDGLSLDTNESILLPVVDGTKAFCLYATRPVNVTALVDGNLTPTVFESQTLLLVTSNMTDVRITNLLPGRSTITVNRLAIVVSTPVYGPMQRQLITFPALSRIAALPQAIISLGKVVVQDVTLATFGLDQSTPFGGGAGVFERFRICNSDGTPNATGAFIMILDDMVSQQNFSGTLQLWVEETP